MHADHSGLIGKLSTPQSSVCFTQEDAPYILGTNWDEFWLQEALYAKKYGFPVDTLSNAIQKHPGYKYAFKGKLSAKVKFVEDGEVLNDVKIVLPGHRRIFF